MYNQKEEEIWEKVCNFNCDHNENIMLRYIIKYGSCGNYYEIITPKKNISSLSLRKEKIQMISNDKGIITFDSTTAPNELKYATLSKSNNNFITCSTAHTFGDHVNEGNFINIVPNNLCVGISHNSSNNEIMARVYTQTNANGSLSTNSCYVATPSSSTIDGITKTEAAQGAIGQAYILNTSE